MQGITIKLSEATLLQLKREASETGRSVSALIRERVEGSPAATAASVYALTFDLAGSLSGGRLPATNDRPKFRRS